MSDYLIANTARFVHETIDGETLLIDGEKGHLWVMTGAGPRIWELLLAGVSIESLAAGIAGRFGASAGDACRAFLHALSDAGLAVPTPAAGTDAAAADWPEAFAAPVLERYDDIANILAMDPIHNVDQSVGWPRPRSPTA